MGRTLDAWCEQCDEVRLCRVADKDPGSCVCSVCGATILLYAPLDPKG